MAPRDPRQRLPEADHRVLQLLAGPVASAAYALRLSSDLEESHGRLLAAREDERRRLRRDLHDGLGPQLAGVVMGLDVVRSSLSRGDTDRASDLALLANWSVTGHWSSAASGLRFSLPAEAPPSDAGALVLAFTLEGSPVTGSVELDPATYLLRRMTWVAGGDTTVQEFSEYGAVGDRALPARVRQTSTGGLPLTIALNAARPTQCAPAFFEPPCSVKA